MFGTSKKLKAAEAVIAGNRARIEDLLQQVFEQEAKLARFRLAREKSNANLRNANAERARLAALRDEAAGLIPQVSE